MHYSGSVKKNLKDKDKVMVTHTTRVDKQMIRLKPEQAAFQAVIKRQSKSGSGVSLND